MTKVWLFLDIIMPKSYTLYLVLQQVPLQDIHPDMAPQGMRALSASEEPAGSWQLSPQLCKT